MNDWPVERELDEKLRQMVNAEVASAHMRQIALRDRPARRSSVAGMMAVLAVVIVLVAAMVWRVQSTSVGEPSGTPSQTPAATVSASPEDTSSASTEPTPTGAEPTAAGDQTGVGCANEAALVTLADGRVLDTEDPNQVTIFDPSSRTFSPAGSMKTAPNDGTATLLRDGRVLLAGGFDGRGDVTIDEIFDPKTASFTQIGPVTPHYPGAAVLLPDGRVLVVGGETDAADIFDPAKGKFTSAGAMVGGGGGGNLSAVLLGNGKALLFEVTGTGSARGRVYDPAAGTFKAVTLPPTPRYGAACLARLPDGRAMVFGGGTDVVEAYDPSSDSFSRLASMPGSADVARYVTLTDGRILALSFAGSEGTWHTGGSRLLDARPEATSGAPNGATTESDYAVEIYDPASDKWTEAGQLASPLMHVDVAATPNGGAIAAGAQGGGGSGSEVEIFDPKTGKFTSI